jgi:tetratricopeptide (TPR) repeat protein
MAKRNKKRPGRESNPQVQERIKRELAKGNAKTALKDAKVAFRTDPTPETRTLLEVAYAGRVEQLHRQHLLTEAQAVLRDLLDFKPVSPDVCQQLPLLQVLVGDKAADPVALFAQQPELLQELSDQAILDWKASAPDYPDLPRQVAIVRDALTAIESGDDQLAAELLQDIPRTSPLSEWKLFARGLSAFYQQDHDRTRANWQRLAPGRPPYRIARTLQVATGDIPPTDAPDVAGNVKRLEKLLGTGDVYEQIVSLGGSWRSGDWRRFLADLRRFRQRHGKTHAATLQQVAELAWRRAVREGYYERFRQLSALLPAPEMDPHWHRVRALFAERSDHGDANAVEVAWKAYAQDMPGLPCLRDDERAIAQGLIYLRLGRKFIEFAEHNALRMRTPWDDDGENEVEDLRQPAANFLRHSIQVCPRLTDAYRELAKLHEELEELDKAASVYEKLLKQMPDDFDARLWLARYHLERDEPTQAEAHTEVARRLKPRDPQCLALGWTQQVTSIRCLTKKRKLDEARIELQNLHKVRSPETELFVLDLIAAAIEFKAKNTETANQFVDLAVSRLEEPTAVWLQMSSIAARYSLSKEVKKEFDQHFKDAIQMRPTSRTAGLLAQYFASLKVNQINYTGRATQERLAIAYVARAKNVRWEERDLALVCEWLYMLPRQAAILGDMTSVGCELFPTSPRLSFVAGADEVRHGPYYCDVEFAAECFRAAIEDSEQAALPLSPDQLMFARESLSRLEEILGHEGRFGADSEFDDEEEDDDYYDDDDEYDDHDPSSLLPPDIGIEELIKTAPPSIIAALKEMATRNGMTIEEVVAKAFRLKSPSEQTPKAPPKPRRRGHAPQGNQTQFAFDDG